MSIVRFLGHAGSRQGEQAGRASSKRAHACSTSKTKLGGCKQTLSPHPSLPSITPIHLQFWKRRAWRTPAARPRRALRPVAAAPSRCMPPTRAALSAASASAPGCPTGASARPRGRCAQGSSRSRRRPPPAGAPSPTSAPAAAALAAAARTACREPSPWCTRLLSRSRPSSGCPSSSARHASTACTSTESASGGAGPATTAAASAAAAAASATSSSSASAANRPLACASGGEPGRADTRRNAGNDMMEPSAARCDARRIIADGAAARKLPPAAPGRCCSMMDGSRATEADASAAPLETRSFSCEPSDRAATAAAAAAAAAPPPAKEDCSRAITSSSSAATSRRKDRGELPSQRARAALGAADLSACCLGHSTRLQQHNLDRRKRRVVGRDRGAQLLAQRGCRAACHCAVAHFGYDADVAAVVGVGCLVAPRNAEHGDTAGPHRGACLLHRQLHVLGVVVAPGNDDHVLHRQKASEQSESLATAWIQLTPGSNQQSSLAQAGARSYCYQGNLQPGPMNTLQAITRRLLRMDAMHGHYASIAHPTWFVHTWFVHTWVGERCALLATALPCATARACATTLPCATGRA
eukprot:144393-Chlamydomonas_euryale.AAC.4